MSRSSCLLHACAVDVMRGKPDVGNFPACGSPVLVTPGLRRRRAYRREYVASPRLTTTDVGLTPRLAYARVVHTAPGDCHYVAAVLGFHDECRLVHCSQSDSLGSEQSFKYLTVVGKKQITVLCNRYSDIAAFIAPVMFCFPAAARHL